MAVQVGDVWWLPEAQAGYPGGKDRYCLIVALEIATGTKVALRAHYVVGSTSRGGRPEIVLERGEANLQQRTYFRFWWSGDIAVATLLRLGKRKGCIDPARCHEIRSAIHESKRAALKRLVR